VVWSDQTLQELARQFVPVAEEVHFLYPEDPAGMQRVAGDPMHQLFRRYGESMPPADWRAVGTKQGIYLMGPEGEYLEGLATASGDPADLRRRFERALARWQTLRKERGYANKPVPQAGTVVPAAFDAAPLLLRVSIRDLAGADCDTTPRWRPGAFDDGNWAEFTRWAWNQNWHAVQTPAVLAPKSAAEEVAEPAWFRRFCCEVFVDNVRGQAPAFADEHVRKAELRMRRGATRQGLVEVAYTGEVELDDGEHRMALRLHGSGAFAAVDGRCERLLLVALGERRGTYAANQRSAGASPSWLGFAVRMQAPAGGRGGKPQAKDGAR
jgi:hypothetical protein